MKTSHSLFFALLITLLFSCKQEDDDVAPFIDLPPISNCSESGNNGEEVREIFAVIEEMPYFPGCEDVFYF